MYALGTKVIINKHLTGVIVDTKVVHKRIIDSDIIKYKIFVANKDYHYWLSPYYFIPMQEIEQNKLKLFFLNLCSKLVILKMQVDFQYIDNK